MSAPTHINAQMAREQNCANQSRDVMLKWFAGGALVFGGGTYLAHMYCQPPSRHTTLHRYVFVRAS